MNEEQALSQMVRPGAQKYGKWGNGVIQIWITRACDLACFGCTQGSNLGGKPRFITLEQFEAACIDLRAYHGVVGVFGGNPALHPQFEEICQILKKHIPPERRGLWCNHPKGKGKIMRETFNPWVSNLNVHLSQEAFDEFKRDWPECNILGQHEDSRHSPPFVAMQDMPELSEEQRWELISRCDINIHWSGLYGTFRNELRFWFCEIAGSQAMLHQDEPDYPDTGIPVDVSQGPKNVWNLTMQQYASQVRYHCHACGIPLRGYGELAVSNPSGTEHVSKTHAAIYNPKRRERLVQLSTNLQEAKANGVGLATDYIGNSHR